MTKSQLLRKIAKLESINDHLATEILFVDALMKSLGFEEGLRTVKATALEILESGYSLNDSEY